MASSKPEELVAKLYDQGMSDDEVKNQLTDFGLSSREIHILIKKAKGLQKSEGKEEKPHERGRRPEKKEEKPPEKAGEKKGMFSGLLGKRKKVEAKAEEKPPEKPPEKKVEKPTAKPAAKGALELRETEASQKLDELNRVFGEEPKAAPKKEVKKEEPKQGFLSGLMGQRPKTLEDVGTEKIGKLEVRKATEESLKLEELNKVFGEETKELQVKAGKPPEKPKEEHPLKTLLKEPAPKEEKKEEKPPEVKEAKPPEKEEGKEVPKKKGFLSGLFGRKKKAEGPKEEKVHDRRVGRRHEEKEEKKEGKPPEKPPEKKEEKPPEKKPEGDEAAIHERELKRLGAIKALISKPMGGAPPPPAKKAEKKEEKPKAAALLEKELEAAAKKEAAPEKKTLTPEEEEEEKMDAEIAKKLTDGMDKLEGEVGEIKKLLETLRELNIKLIEVMEKK